jgi:hypothetical protein
MPKLSDPRITKGHAVSFLLRLYFDEPEFVTALCQLRQDHSELLAELIAKQLDFVKKCRAVLTTEQYEKTVHDLQGLLVLIGPNPDLPPDLACELQEIKQITVGLGSYFRGLEELASRWKLRAPWAGPMLHLHVVHDYLKELGVPDTIGMPLEQMDLLYPWPPPIPSLEIKISAWAFVFYGRREIQARIAGKLKDYEGKLKAAGLKEKPTALQEHARWWFEHHVKGKSFPELAEQFPDVYAETIKRKVWEFSKLLGTRTR